MSQNRQKPITKSDSEKASKGRKRAKFECPGGVELLLELVNSIPVDREFPHFQQLMEVAGQDQRAVGSEMKRKLEGVPKEYYRGSLAPPMREYIVFRQIRMAMRDLANLVRVPAGEREDFIGMLDDCSYDNRPEFIDADAEKKWIGFRNKYEKLGVHFWDHHTEFDEGIWHLMHPTYPVPLTLAENNTLQPQLPKYGLHHLVGIDITRLRVCQDCLRMFWAKKTDSRFCEWECGNRFRRRESYYKKKRQEYREIKGIRARAKRSQKS
jgi:hypothetical protein